MNRCCVLVLLCLLGAGLCDPCQGQSIVAAYTSAAREARDRRDFDKAEKMFALALKEAGNDAADAAQILQAMENLGTFYYGQARYEDAARVFRAALDAVDAYGVNDSLANARLLRCMGAVHEKRKEFNESETCYRRALAQVDRLNESDHGETAQLLNDLAWVEYRQGRMDEAEALAGRAVVLAHATFGPQHAVVANHLDTLATVYSAQGRHDEAQALAAEAVAIAESTLGGKHRKTATFHDTLGEVHAAAGNAEQASEHFLIAKQIQTDLLPEDHPDLLETIGHHEQLQKRDRSKN